MSKYDLTFLLNEEAELKTLKELVASLDCKIVSEEKYVLGLSFYLYHLIIRAEMFFLMQDKLSRSNTQM